MLCTQVLLEGSRGRNACRAQTLGRGSRASRRGAARSPRPFVNKVNLLLPGVPSRSMPPRRSSTSSPSPCSAPGLGRRRWKVGSTSAGDASIPWNVWPRWRASRPTRSSPSAVSCHAAVGPRAHPHPRAGEWGAGGWRGLVDRDL